jgi:hypothetical protein
MTQTDHPHPRRNRMLLLVIFAIFLGSMLLAGVLRFSGWRPAGMKNNGELLQPPVDLRARIPKLADGSDYLWNPAARTWRIVLAPPAGCAEACITLAQDIDIVWKLMGRNADQVDVLWLCAEPGCSAPAPLRDGLPRATDPKGFPVYLLDPNGFVVLRYAPGFDPADLRTDLSRLLKVN